MKKNTLFIIMLAVMFSFAFTAENGALSFGVSSALAKNDHNNDNGNKDDHGNNNDNGNKDDHGNNNDNGNKDDHGNNNDNGNKDDNGNSNKVTICHVPPGNPSNKQTLSVSQSAVNAHMAHGDSMGACRVTICHFTTSTNSSSNNESENKNEDKNENKNSNKNDDSNGHHSAAASSSVTATTIEINESDLNAYLAQGDTQGACSPCARPSVSGIVDASNATCTRADGTPGVRSGANVTTPSSVREVFGN
ncbi:hypothetical protein [Mariprofundus ferrooxydans]|uniref:hypothetical protein n=1 Tax=Mariprofundus ferrooxydans TaxID=314344 RepID=UPI00143214C7|nr:hypothetical protein [Mariprofundus ferrooxydans]